MGYYWTDKYILAPYYARDVEIYQDPSNPYGGGGISATDYDVEYVVQYNRSQPTEDTQLPNHWNWHWAYIPDMYYYGCVMCGARFQHVKEEYRYEGHGSGEFYPDMWPGTSTYIREGEVWHPEGTGPNPTTPPMYWYDLQNRDWVRYAHNNMLGYLDSNGEIRYPRIATYGCCCNGSVAGNGYTQPTVAATATINGLTVNLYKLSDSQAAAYIGKHMGVGPNASTQGNRHFYNKPLLYKTNIEYPEGDVWQFQSDRKWHKVHPFYQKQSNGSWKAVQPYYYANTSSTWKKVENVN